MITTDYTKSDSHFIYNLLMLLSFQEPYQDNYNVGDIIYYSYGGDYPIDGEIVDIKRYINGGENEIRLLIKTTSKIDYFHHIYDLKNVKYESIDPKRYITGKDYFECQKKVSIIKIENCKRLLKSAEEGYEILLKAEEQVKYQKEIHKEKPPK